MLASFRSCSTKESRVAPLALRTFDMDRRTVGLILASTSAVGGAIGMSLGVQLRCARNVSSSDWVCHECALVWLGRGHSNARSTGEIRRYFCGYQNSSNRKVVLGSTACISIWIPLSPPNDLYKSSCYGVLRGNLRLSGLFPILNCSQSVLLRVAAPLVAVGIFVGIGIR